METALYYPHTSVQSSGILKTALLLWDNLECITPGDRAFRRRRFKSRQYNEAHDLLVVDHAPTVQEKRRAHSAVAKLLKECPPLSFLQDTVSERNTKYVIYPNKFLAQTWELLERSGLAEYGDLSDDYSVPPAFSYLMMSILANECAGTQKQVITNRVKAYSWVSEFYANELGGKYVTGLDASDVGLKYQRLITMSLQVLGADKIPVKSLLAMRKREAKGNSSDYREMRRRYRETLTEYVNRIQKDAKTGGDVKEIHRQFKEDMKQDLKDLKAELNLASISALFSKEMVVTAIVVAGALATPISGITTLATTMKGVGVAPLIKTAATYRSARNKALRKSAMSWLFVGKQKKLALQ